jgi:anti-sigma factor RsiW
MANAGDEQQRERQRQQRELAEIRRNFAEMGARMGSLFEPADADEPKPAPRPEQRALPAPPPAPSLFAGRPRWWWAAALTLLFLAGGLFGWLLRGEGGSEPPPTPTTVAAAVPPAPPETVIRTKTSVPEACLDTAKLGDEVIARLTRNQRDNRLFPALRKYTIASQACRREASP